LRDSRSGFHRLPDRCDGEVRFRWSSLGVIGTYFYRIDNTH
jgi:hypothetical protein